MRQIDMSGPGGPEVLALTRREIPVPKPDQVLVKVAYAGVNGPDIMQRKGLYPPPADASKTLGLEIAGEIVATGRNVRRWKSGDVVCALTNGGGYAEYCAVNQHHCLPVPGRLSLAEAASLPETYFTVWSNIFMPASLSAAQTFLVHGGAGGLGTTAIQLGKAFGAKVVATDSPTDRVIACADLGADRAINYASEDFVEIVRNEFGGADVILDIVGGMNIQKNLKVARHDARIIQLAFAMGSKAEVDFMPVMLKRLHYTGSTLRSRSDEFKSDVAHQLEAHVWPLFARGCIKAVANLIMPLTDAAEAHRLMERAGHFGKIVLQA